MDNLLIKYLFGNAYCVPSKYKAVLYRVNMVKVKSK